MTGFAPRGDATGDVADALDRAHRGAAVPLRGEQLHHRKLRSAGGRDTVDNLREVRALLPPGPVALLSNRYHLARCQAIRGRVRPVWRHAPSR